MLKLFIKSLLFTISILLLVLVGFLAHQEYEVYLLIQEFNNQVEEIEKNDPTAGVGYTIYSTEERDMGLSNFMVLTIPATIGLYILIRKLRQ